MKTKYEDLIISKEEYLFFLTLSANERLDYLFNLYDAASQSVSALDLSKFFNSLHTELQENTEEKLHVLSESTNPAENIDRVDVMIDDEIIMIEANSLRALRSVKDRFIEVGYILQRDHAQEKMFRKDKVTRYMRIFYIVDQITGLCFN